MDSKYNPVDANYTCRSSTYSSYNVTTLSDDDNVLIVLKLPTISGTSTSVHVFFGIELLLVLNTDLADALNNAVVEDAVAP